MTQQELRHDAKTWRRINFDDARTWDLIIDEDGPRWIVAINENRGTVEVGFDGSETLSTEYVRECCDIRQNPSPRVSEGFGGKTDG